MHANRGAPALGEVGGPQELARHLLAGVGDRWDHIREVAARARSVAAAVPDEDRRLLVDAAWLHDIGYSPEVSRTGFHPLDGARYLMSVGAPTDLVGAVANHSCARFEAEERGLEGELEAFPAPSEAVMDALAYADMTTGPTGLGVSVEDRLTEILEQQTDLLLGPKDTQDEVVFLRHEGGTPENAHITDKVSSASSQTANASSRPAPVETVLVGDSPQPTSAVLGWFTNPVRAVAGTLWRSRSRVPSSSDASTRMPLLQTPAPG